MMKNFRWDKKYLYWGVTAFCVVIACIVFFMILQRWGAVRELISSILGILSPFIWGFVIAYLLTPMARWFQRRLFAPLAGGLFKKETKREKRIFSFSRTLSILLSIIIMYALVTSLLWLVLPQLYSSIDSLVRNMSEYFKQIEGWLQDLFENYPDIEEFAVAIIGDLSTGLASWIRTSLLPMMDNLVSSVSSSVVLVVRGIYNILVGTVVSIYVLYNKETFAAHIKKVLYSVFKKKHVKDFLHALDFADKTVMGFVSGKVLDSLIISVICYVGCSLLGMPYVVLVSVIVGVTNIIPFFGPFIGAIPCAMIILMVSPMKCLIFIIFIILLQQLDGNIIGPKILGSTVGINGFWIMFSIILGAGLFGFLGMLLGVPVFSVIYAGIRYVVNARLEKRGLPVETAKYKAKGSYVGDDEKPEETPEGSERSGESDSNEAP